MAIKKRRQLRWTDKQKEIRDLLLNGVRRQAVITKGYSKALVSRVEAALKEEKLLPLQKAETEAGTKAESKAETEEPPRDPFSPPPVETKYRTRTLDVINVGELQILPEDWRINQYGAFMVLHTLHYARKHFGYEGSVGDLLCDGCQILRLAMGLDAMPFDYLVKEGTNGGSEEEGTNEGGSLLTEAGNQSSGEEQPEGS